jgi:hypothetical protein
MDSCGDERVEGWIVGLIAGWKDRVNEDPPRLTENV